MSITRVNFSALASGGDTPTGALVKLDANDADLDARKLGTAAGGQVNQAARFMAGGGAVAFGADGTAADHVFIPLYPRSSQPSLRGGYWGYSAAGVTQMVMSNALGGIDFQPSGPLSVNGQTVWSGANTTVDSNNFIKKV